MIASCFCMCSAKLGYVEVERWRCYKRIKLLEGNGNVYKSVIYDKNITMVN